MKIYAGYDSGGTKTKCVLADEKGTVLSQAMSGASNILFCGWDAAADAIRQCTEKAMEEAGLSRNQAIYSAYVGTASINTFSRNEKIYNFLQECTGAEHLGMNSDAYIAWYATTFGDSGIITISGTGAVTVGIGQDGRWKKSSGWGCLIGDEGSGFSIGRRAIQLAVKSYDGRCEKNRFEQGIMDFFALKSMQGLLPLIYGQPGGSNTVVASAARYVFQLYEEGDPLAAEILQEAASEIAAAIRSVYDQLDFSGRRITIGLSGGVLYRNREMHELIDTRLNDWGIQDYMLEYPHVSPEISALALSFRQIGDAAGRNAIDKIIEEMEVDSRLSIAAADYVEE